MKLVLENVFSIMNSFDKASMKWQLCNEILSSWFKGICNSYMSALLYR